MLSYFQNSFPVSSHLTLVCALQGRRKRKASMGKHEKVAAAAQPSGMYCTAVVLTDATPIHGAPALLCMRVPLCYTRALSGKTIC